MTLASNESASERIRHPTSSTTLLPHIHLLCLQKPAAPAFTTAIASHGLGNEVSFEVHYGTLSELPGNLTFDLVVSPANSYGILDGGFDYAISRAWSPRTDFHALTRKVQAELYEHYHGFLAPGNCQIVRMPSEFKGHLRYNNGQGWECEYIAMCPTMRTPSECNWDREVVYECIWNLLCAIQRHNKTAETKGKRRIESILMTPLGTATGLMTLEKWAQQAALAIKHFLDADRNSKAWSQINWPEAEKWAREVAETHDK